MATKKDHLLGPLTAAKVILKPASQGRGIVAGGAVRAVCALAGIKHVTGKILNSANKINIARAAIIALKELKQPKAEVKNSKHAAA